MTERNYRLHDGKMGAAIAVRVTPHARRNEIVGTMQDGTININIASQPPDQAASEDLIDFLAEVLGVPKSRLEVVAGVGGRDKLISVLDMDAETLHKKIIEHIS